MRDLSATDLEVGHIRDLDLLELDPGRGLLDQIGQFAGRFIKLEGILDLAEPHGR